MLNGIGMPSSFALRRSVSSCTGTACASAIMSTSRPKPIPVSSRFWRNWPSQSPTVGKFWTPEKPTLFTSSRNTGIRRNGSVPQTPARTGVSRTMGSTSPAISTTIALASP